MKPLELTIVRDLCSVGSTAKEGFSLGKVSVDAIFYGYTLEDEDRHLEDGTAKIYGRTAMPLGRYLITLYMSPKHGLVPLFNGVPGFSYTEMHGANHAEQVLGCVGVGRFRTEDGVATCAPVLARIVDAIQHAEDEGRECYCTISRA